MRGIALFLVILLSSLLAAPASGGEGDRWLIRDVHLITMQDDNVLRDRDVLIRDGRIEAISESGAKAPESVRVIEGKGGYLMPGLAEMHAHVPGSQADEQLREDILFLYLSNGITLARGMLGEALHLDMRESLASGDLLGPRLITSGPSLNGRSVASPEAGKGMVREQAEAGYDFLKIHPGLSRAEFDAIAKTANELGIDFAGHVPEAVGIERALEAGYASIDHLDRYLRALVSEQTLESTDPGFFDYHLAPHVKSDRIAEIAAKTREAGVWNVPTETLMHNVLLLDPERIREDRPEFRYLPESMIESWIDRVRQTQTSEDYDRDAAEDYIEVRLALIAALHEAEAGLLLGSDAPQIFNVPGFSIHHEMAILERAGLSPYDILKTGTVNPARFFDKADDWGRIEEGMRAELLLLDANPLEDLDNLRDPRGVMTENHWLDQAAISQRLEAIEERYAR